MQQNIYGAPIFFPARKKNPENQETTKEIAVLQAGCVGVGRHLLDHVVSSRSLLAALVFPECVCELSDKVGGSLSIGSWGKNSSQKVNSLGCFSHDDCLGVVDCSASTETVEVLSRVVDHGSGHISLQVHVGWTSYYSFP
ncbi:hypothetical protein MLD38_008182 [Melastoma candidum]|uniref:Uncharacterized protein n=1 Tax=Melastoma candidum TaxID=119954 RepID=A0ACB9RUR3_9MYRT|nr:hypothetical protein MLD38_008182 [Melastoma candidum]